MDRTRYGTSWDDNGLVAGTKFQGLVDPLATTTCLTNGNFIVIYRLEKISCDHNKCIRLLQLLFKIYSAVLLGGREHLYPR